MSRIGRMPIPLPTEWRSRRTAAGHGEGAARHARAELHPGSLEREDGDCASCARSDGRGTARYGLTRTLVNNMVTGVTSGFTKNLEISGVGYRAQLRGREARAGAGLLPPGRGRPARRHRVPRRDAHAARRLRRRQGARRPDAAHIRSRRRPSRTRARASSIRASRSSARPARPARSAERRRDR